MKAIDDERATMRRMTMTTACADSMHGTAKRLGLGCWVWVCVVGLASFMHKRGRGTLGLGGDQLQEFPLL